MSGDYLNRYICDELNIRAYTATTLFCVREITRLHRTTPLSSLFLARTVNAAALLGSGLKPDSRQSLSLKFSGSGPIREIHVQIDAGGSIRGYIAHPSLEINDDSQKNEFGALIGAGFLTVIRDTGLNQPYHGTIPLQAGDIARDTAYYLTMSEQTPSALIIAVTLDEELRIASSGGILIQVFPETDPSVIAEIEENILSNKTSLGTFLRDGGDIRSFLSEILDRAPIENAGKTELKHKCRCNKALLNETLKAFDPGELSDMIEKDGGAEVHCTFCGQVYQFSGSDLSEIITEKQ